MELIERITVGEINKGINVFYGKNHESWVRGGGPGPEYKDCSLYDFIREIAPKHGVKVEQENEELDYQMYDMLFDGPETKEGLIAFFYSAVVQAVEMRERLRMIEEVLCGDENKFDIDRLRELIEADKAGRCVVLPSGEFTNKDGENALKSAMNTCFYYNNPVTRYIADAVAEKLAREEAEAALEKMKEAARE